MSVPAVPSTLSFFGNALIPGFAEKLVQATKDNSLNALSRAVKFYRNGVYIATAATLIVAVGGYIAHRNGKTDQEKEKIKLNAIRLSVVGTASAAICALLVLTKVSAIRHEIFIRAWYEAL